MKLFFQNKFPLSPHYLLSQEQEELKKYQIVTGDTEGIVNYALSINGIRFAILVVDRGEARKLSFRSKGEFPANEVAKKYFEGGGHRNAAGGISFLTLMFIHIFVYKNYQWNYLARITADPENLKHYNFKSYSI